MPSRRIPQEIYDEIIAILRDDEATLRSCSVVCRAWLFRTRHHLFHTIALDPSSRSHRYKALVHSCPDAALLVRVLKLRGRASMRRGWWDPENGVPAILVWPTLPGSGTQTNPFRRESDVLETLSWLRDTFTSTSHDRPGAINLPNVRSLRLDEVTFNTDTASFLAASFPRVESLTLSGCRAMAFTSLQVMLQSFQQLQSLHLLSAEWLPHQSGPSSLTMTLTLPPLATLTHLEFTRDIFVHPVLDWLLKASAHRTIRSLKCSIATQTSAKALRSFLEASGPTLQEISIALAESRDPTAILETTQFDLSPCTGLERLTVQCSPSRSVPEHNSLSWVLILLSKVCSPCLRDLRISITPAQVARFNLEGLDVVLANNCYGSLQSLIFVLDSDSVRTVMGVTMESTLKQRLLTAHAHGIIQVEYV